MIGKTQLKQILVDKRATPMVVRRMQPGWIIRLSSIGQPHGYFMMTNMRRRDEEGVACYVLISLSTPIGEYRLVSGDTAVLDASELEAFTLTPLEK